MSLLLAAALLLLDRHDYVYPRLSPDGTKLAVARAMMRPDGHETTAVEVIDVDSGAAREVVTQSEAEADEVYETYVVGLTWLDDRRLQVSLSDGDVGGSEITVDVATGAILEHDVEDEDDSAIYGELQQVLDAAPRYARYFSRRELELSLGASAAPLASGRVLVQRSVRRSPLQPIFFIDPKTHAARIIARVRPSLRLQVAREVGDDIIYLLAGEQRTVVHRYRAGRTRTLAAVPVSLHAQCTRIEEFGGGRLLLFIRPCDRTEPGVTTLWELAGGKAIPRTLDPQLDEFSVSSDGRRIAIASWRNGKRLVRVLDGPPF